MASEKEREAFAKVASAFPKLAISEIMKLVRDAYRGMYAKGGEK